jgi:hypothetical protein
VSSANTANAPVYPQTPPAFEPTIDGSDKAQQNAAAQYTKTYGGSVTVSNQNPSSSNGPFYNYPEPDVTAAYQQAPDFVPNPPPGSGSGTPGGGASDSDAFLIDLAALKAAEQVCLGATEEAITACENLKSTVSSAVASPTIFGQEVDKDPLDADAKQFALGMEATMSQVLYYFAGVVELMGQFNALLNNAGQMYTWADYSSAFAAE